MHQSVRLEICDCTKKVMMCTKMAFLRQLAGTRRLEQEATVVINLVVDKMLKENTDTPTNLKYYILQAVYITTMIVIFGKR